MATGGVFVGGGIAPKIIEKLKDSTFMEAFTALMSSPVVAGSDASAYHPQRQNGAAGRCALGFTA